MAESLGLPFRWPPKPDPVVMDMASYTIATEQPYIHRLTRMGIAACQRGRGLAYIDEVSRLIFGSTVEGWHEGEEWIDSGALVERVNFVASELGDVNKPGIRAIIDRLATDNGGRLSPSEVVDRCLDLIGPVVVSDSTRSALTEHVSNRGDVDLTSHERGDEPEQRVGELLSLIAATREFQLA